MNNRHFGPNNFQTKIIILLTIMSILVPAQINATATPIIPTQATIGQSKTYKITESSHYFFWFPQIYYKPNFYFPLKNSHIIITATKDNGTGYSANFTSADGHTTYLSIPDYGAYPSFMYPAYNSTTAVQEYVNTYNKDNTANSGSSGSASVSGNYLSTKTTQTPAPNIGLNYSYSLTTTINWHTGWLESWSYTSVGARQRYETIWGNYTGKIQLVIGANNGRSSPLSAWQTTNFVTFLIVISLIIIQRRKKHE